jgi:hypothetical protein
MNYWKLLMQVASSLYAVMRPILLKAVDDPEADWDDRLMAAADAFFGWSDES